MGYKVVSVFAAFCLLQFASGNECTKIQIRIPVCSFNGGISPKFNTQVPYPMFRNNNMCQFCNGNNPFRFTPLPNSFIASIPSKKSRTGRITLTIDTGSGAHGKEAVTPAFKDIDEKVVDVIVKVLNKNETTASSPTTTSGKSSAISNKFGDRLTANTSGLIFIPGSDKVVDVSVVVRQDKTGKSTGISKLKSNIITDDGQGSVSHTNTEADIKKTDDANSADKTVESNNEETKSGKESGAAAGSVASGSDGTTAAGSAATGSDGTTAAASAADSDKGSASAAAAKDSDKGSAASAAAADSDGSASKTAAGAASDDGSTTAASAADGDGGSAAAAAAS